VRPSAATNSASMLALIICIRLSLSSKTLIVLIQTLTLAYSVRRGELPAAGGRRRRARPRVAHDLPLRAPPLQVHS